MKPVSTCRSTAEGGGGGGAEGGAKEQILALHNKGSLPISRKNPSSLHRFHCHMHWDAPPGLLPCLPTPVLAANHLGSCRSGQTGLPAKLHCYPTYNLGEDNLMPLFTDKKTRMRLQNEKTLRPFLLKPKYFVITSVH